MIDVSMAWFFFVIHVHMLNVAQRCVKTVFGHKGEFEIIIIITTISDH